jgi:uncharacterized membrane protein
MQKYRIEGLSDLVFGLALSIGSLAMINQPVTSSRDIIDGILGFVFGFMVIVSVWISYTKIISEIRVETKMDLRLNIALLMMVAIEPYLLYLLGHDDPEIQNFATMAYAIDIGLIMVILASLYNRNPAEGTPEEMLKENREDRNHFITVAVIFLFSALPFFWQQAVIFNINLRYLIWLCAIIPGVAVRAIHLLHRVDRHVI